MKIWLPLAITISAALSCYHAGQNHTPFTAIWALLATYYCWEAYLSYKARKV